MAQPAVQSCYIALGIVHRLWKPIPGEFDDYIAVPKDNLIKACTLLSYDDGKTLEVQIRTRAMHLAAEFGIAAHWLYKDGSAQISGEYQKHIDQLREAIRAMGSDAKTRLSLSMR